MRKCTGNIDKVAQLLRKLSYKSTKVGLEIVDFISHQIVILPCSYAQLVHRGWAQLACQRSSPR
jgi:hypothetical protein